MASSDNDSESSGDDKQHRGMALNNQQQIEYSSAEVEGAQHHAAVVNHDHQETIDDTSEREDSTASDYLSPQMIQQQRVKAMERESREAAQTQRTQKEKHTKKKKKTKKKKTNTNMTAQLGAAAVNNHNIRQQRPYPNQLEKYWDDQFDRISASDAGSTTAAMSASKRLESNDDSSPYFDGISSNDVGSNANTNGHQHSSPPAAPGAYAHAGPEAMGDSDRQNQDQERMKDEEAPPETVSSTDGNTLVQANKVDDAEMIIQATDVQNDNFKRKLVVAGIFLFCLALGLGLYFGLRKDQTPKCKYNDPRCCEDSKDPYDDPRCCDYSEEPTAHLAPLSCYCFNTTELLEDEDDHKYNQTLYDASKRLFLTLYQSEDIVGTSTEKRKAFVATLEGLTGNSCHPYDQFFLMFANEGIFSELLLNKRTDIQKRNFVLGQIFIATNGIDWAESEGWFDEEEESTCSWYGVGCLFEDHINVLELPANNLKGKIPSGISLFSSLQELDLSGNEELTGTIPRELGRLGELTRLELSETSLSGTIPVDLAGLNQLHKLSLTGQDDECVGLTGTIPPQIFNSNFLRIVELQMNSFSSPLPTEVGEAINLQNLVLTSSGLTGNLPTELASIDRLKVLDIGSNQLDGGPIPPELGNLLRLEFLNVANSGLNEAIPETFCVNSTAFASKHLFVLSNCSLGYPVCSCCRLSTDTEDGDFGGRRVRVIDVTCVDETREEKDGAEDCNSSN